MKKRLLFILCSIFITVGFVSAQTAKRTVTNADLEKFRQKRLAAEKSYRENYARLGFPSPEEMEKERVESRKELARLSARIENENFQLEQMRRAEANQREHDTLRIIQFNQGAGYGNGYYPPFYSGGFVGYGYSNGFYSSNFGRNGRFDNFEKFSRFGLGGNFYNPIIPGTVFPPNGGVRINTNGVRISGSFGGGRISTGIRGPR